MEPLAAFAQNVRAERAALGISQHEVAERAGLTLAYVGKIERAEIDPGVRTVARLARGLSVEPAALFAGVPQADDNTPRKGRSGVSSHRQEAAREVADERDG
jgi:transcriptional regulator with XRE-family HTH domain